jgi:hypothetical protein
MLVDLVEKAQSLIGDSGHKAGIDTARRVESLLRDAALRHPESLENGTLSGEEQRAGWNLDSSGQAAEPASGTKRRRPRRARTKRSRASR